MSEPTPAEAERWMAQWRDAATLLEERRALELRCLTHEEALRASERVLRLADPTQLPPHRLTWSGLVEQQALFHGK